MNNQDEREATEWAVAQVKRNFGPMQESAMFLGIVGEDVRKNALQCLQFGMAVMFDKPIALMVIEGAVIPEKLRTIADHIECVKADRSNLDAATKNIIEAMKPFLKPTE